MVSLLSRMAAHTANDELAKLVTALLSVPEVATPSSSPRQPPFAPTGIGTSAARVLDLHSAEKTILTPPAAAPAAAARIPTKPTGLGTSAINALLDQPTTTSLPEAPATDDASSSSSSNSSLARLHCPPHLRDDRALGEEVNQRLLAWAEEIGIYPGQLEKVQRANFGRLMMLTHAETSDPERLLAAARCALAEWSVDDHYIDGDVDQVDPDLLGQRLAIAYAAIDPAHLPQEYAPQLEQTLRNDPVMRALRSSISLLGEFATGSQVSRLRHELSVMFVAYNQEAVWRHTKEMPPVWEYIMHRHENSFIPCMVLIDAVGGYELPRAEFDDDRVRRAFTMAGTASVIVNDLYSMPAEDDTDTSLPRVIANEDGCSIEEAIDRTVDIHNELMHTFEAESAVLFAAGSPALKRFLGGVWAWLGGNREWHRTTGRYAPQETKS
jgi:2-methylisoborneol synthase